MPNAPIIKPNSPAIRDYHATLNSIAAQGESHEGATSSAFQTLLQKTAPAVDWTLIPQKTIRVENRNVRPDGTLQDSFKFPRGYWEAKDTADDLEAEIRKKRELGYPLDNTIFEDTREAVLYQGRKLIGRFDLLSDKQVADLLNTFFGYTAPPIQAFHTAVAEFGGKVKDVGAGLDLRIKAARQDPTFPEFQAAYAEFVALCRESINPKIEPNQIDEMLVQHLLTERLIRTIFNNPDFRTKNVIAAAVERVIAVLISRNFNREEFIGQIGRFYEAVEESAKGLHDYSEKQDLLNTVYDRFFQGYARETADTHGIVYTPQPIVDFMCASVIDVLQTEFGKTLADPDVVILDPCTGTGNFIVNLLRRAQQNAPLALDDLYRGRLFANEIMLLPYYVASLNIENAYHDLTGRYKPFPGLCFVDTLSLKHGIQTQLSGFAEDNRKRIVAQGNAPITVILGNPPYNVGQQNENDNNKNRRYLGTGGVDTRIKETYAKDSAATNRNSLSDPYIKFFRWASDRLQGRDGVICYVSNNGFIDNRALDGMRKHLFAEFSRIYVINLQGNIRKDSMRDGIPLGEQHTVFGLSAMVGVSIITLIKHRKFSDRRIFYSTVDWKSTREEKFRFLEKAKVVGKIEWKEITPDKRHDWLVPENADQYANYLPMGDKAAKRTAKPETIFATYSRGVGTSRDEVVYDFNPAQLTARVQQFIEDYNAEVDRYKRAGKPKDVDKFVKYERIKWSRDLKQDLKRGHYAEYDPAKIRRSLYRPFSSQWYYLDPILSQDIFRWPQFFPTPATEAENRVICVTDTGSEKPFMALMTQQIADLHIVGAGSSAQCFPFYVYDPDGTNRRENITDWALQQFRDHYADPKIDKWAIFYYVYGLLHHPTYREKYAGNLKRELPRLPYAPDFWAFSRAGQSLADLHLNYESAALYPLTVKAKAGHPLSWRVQKMRLNKDKTVLTVNESLTLAGIPAAALGYKLGSRSALEWVIDQYQVSGESDPNRAEDQEYIVNLVRRVVTVSVETVRIVAGVGGLSL